MSPKIETPAPTQAHQWVRWSVVEVAVIVDPFTGVPSVEDVPFSAEGSQVACRGCGESLTESSVLTACTGEE